MKENLIKCTVRTSSDLIIECTVRTSSGLIIECELSLKTIKELKTKNLVSVCQN